MRILSKFKDFYDYVVTEPDNKKMFLRDTTLIEPDNARKLYHKYGQSMQFNPKHIDAGFISVLAFCDKFHKYFQYENLIYWRYEDIPEEIIKKITPRSKWWKIENDYEHRFWGRDALNDMLHYKTLGWVCDRHTKEPIKTDFNKVFNSPIVFVALPDYNKIIVNPKLNDFGFNKVISPTEAYQDIYNWIPYNEPEVPKSPDDMSRYEAKGFDKKTSFRPNMK